jgi:hypothetical protein
MGAERNRPERNASPGLRPTEVLLGDGLTACPPRGLPSGRIRATQLFLPKAWSADRLCNEVKDTLQAYVDATAGSGPHPILQSKQD